MWWLFGAIGCGSVSAAGPAVGFAQNPEELGRVAWTRGLDEALIRASREHKPVVILFDEVPGCSTVKAYGRGTLSDPLVVDAIESLFVPVLVQNNVDGPDHAVLQRYGEPAWNNPVVRVVDAEGDDLVPRLTSDWTEGALMAHLVDALVASGATVPDWLLLTTRERTLAAPQTSTYNTACFWSGEAHMGATDGVLATRTGFQGGREVVEVTWDPRAIDRIALDARASTGGYRTASTGSFAPSPSDDLWQLRRTTWSAVPMTPAQATRVNADLGAGRDPSRWLSPRQLALHASAAGPSDLALSRAPIRQTFDRALAR